MKSSTRRRPSSVRLGAALAAGALLVTTAGCGSGSDHATGQGHLAANSAAATATATAATAQEASPTTTTAAPAPSASADAAAPAAETAVAHHDRPSAPIKNSVTVTMPGMRYVVRGHLKPGVAAITLRNTDDEAHMMAVARLRPGATEKQVRAAMKKGGEHAVTPLLADTNMAYGVPTLVGAGASSTVTAPDLPAGTYVLICFLNGKDGMPHWAMGMIGSMKVKGPKQHVTPRSKGTITISDKAIRLPRNFDGHGTYLVKDVGKKPHNLSFAQLSKGTSLERYAGYIGMRMNSGKPIDGGGGVLEGGIDGLNPGAHAWVTLDLPRGHYGYISTEDVTGPGLPPQHGEFDVR